MVVLHRDGDAAQRRRLRLQLLLRGTEVADEGAGVVAVGGLILRVELDHPFGQLRRHLHHVARVAMDVRVATGLVVLAGLVGVVMMRLVLDQRGEFRGEKVARLPWHDGRIGRPVEQRTEPFVLEARPGADEQIGSLKIGDQRGGRPNRSQDCRPARLPS